MFQLGHLDFHDLFCHPLSSQEIANFDRGMGTAERSEAINILLFYLREFPTPVILDQARERAALNGKFGTRFSDEVVHP